MTPGFGFSLFTNHIVSCNYPGSFKYGVKFFPWHSYAPTTGVRMRLLLMKGCKIDLGEHSFLVRERVSSADEVYIWCVDAK